MSTLLRRGLGPLPRVLATRAPRVIQAGSSWPSAVGPTESRWFADSTASEASSAPRRGRGVLKALGVLTLGGAAAYGGIMYVLKTGPEPPTEDVRLIEDLPTDLANWTFTLFQYESCPFCRKARAVLDYHKVSYEVVEVNPLSKRELRGFAKDYSKVPILQLRHKTTGEAIQLRDSKRIVDRCMLTLGGTSRPDLSAIGIGAPEATPQTTAMWPGPAPKEDAKEPAKPQPAGATGVEELWVQWSDKVLVQLVVCNVYRTLAEARETMDYLLTNPEMRKNTIEMFLAYWSGAVVMRILASVRQRKFKVENEREALYEALERFASEVGDKPFLAGNKPGRADFNIYGVMRSCEGFPTERDARAKAPRFAAWYNRMEKIIGPSRATFRGGEASVRAPLFN
eukprot:TRINITY_DN64040_c0_g1_i1.p1 TRINITY_DN64040_c0_g1~~TRINITY_DN64040_c0_g1_i1.p1  ORF type:complete len:397 (-),score=94.91 TRINITY_DN64040_c0_g1_i1:264-1454(-)